MSNSSVSFDRAVKHLFRHLHEARALCKNPLVLTLFADARVAGVLRAGRERAAMAWIHELVREGARECYESDVMAGKSERAERQRAIVARECLGRTPLEDVARSLAISARHCYRERADICKRIGHYIAKRINEVAIRQISGIDEFSVLVDYTMHRADFQNDRAAVRACEALLSSAATPLQKIEALYASGMLAIKLGNLARAETVPDAANAIVQAEGTLLGDDARRVADAYIDHLGAEIAYEHGSGRSALHLAENAVEKLRPFQSNAPRRVYEVYAGALFSLASAFWSLGDVDSAYDRLGQAQALSKRIASLSTSLRTKISSSTWKLRSYLSLDCTTWYPSFERIQGLSKVLELALDAGLVRESIDALVIITENHAFAQRHDDAVRAGNFAIQLASQQRRSDLRRLVAIEIGTRLLRTDHWRHASALVSAKNGTEGLGAYHHDLLMYSAAELALRRRSFDAAWALTQRTRAKAPWATLKVRKSLVAAEAAYELGKQCAAKALIEYAVPAAEELRAAPIVLDAYRIAGKVTGDLRFSRRAQEVARLLTA